MSFLLDGNAHSRITQSLPVDKNTLRFYLTAQPELQHVHGYCEPRSAWMKIKTVLLSGMFLRLF